MKLIISELINAGIFLTTAVLIFFVFREDGEWSPRKGALAFRFFTVLSNTLCAVSSLVLLICQLSGQVPQGIWLFKYVGTAAVTVTLMTVLVFLGPTAPGGYKDLLTGSGFYMHLLGPVAAIISCCFLEEGTLSFAWSLLGMIPTILYGILYLYKLKAAPPGKNWEDFYGFDKGGHWKVSFTAMMIGTFLICLMLMGLTKLGS